MAHASDGVHNLMDLVLPQTALRQWVLTFPFSPGGGGCPRTAPVPGRIVFGKTANGLAARVRSLLSGSPMFLPRIDKK